MLPNKLLVICQLQDGTRARVVAYLYVMDGVMARGGGGSFADGAPELRCGWTFDAAWLALREAGWVRVGGVCARSGLAWTFVRYGAEYYTRTASPSPSVFVHRRSGLLLLLFRK
jgi:hypothetical protein